VKLKLLDKGSKMPPNGEARLLVVGEERSVHVEDVG
jgi:hypothetical protein